MESSGLWSDLSRIGCASVATFLCTISLVLGWYMESPSCMSIAENITATVRRHRSAYGRTAHASCPNWRWREPVSGPEPARLVEPDPGIDASNITINAGSQFTMTNDGDDGRPRRPVAGTSLLPAADMVHFANSQINASVQCAQTTIGGDIVIDPTSSFYRTARFWRRRRRARAGTSPLRPMPWSPMPRAVWMRRRSLA